MTTNAISGWLLAGQAFRLSTGALHHQREAVINALKSPETREHRVQFYDSDHFLVRTAFEFVESARRSGHAVILIAGNGHLEALQRMLHAQDTAEGHTAPHECVFLDANETLARFMQQGHPDAQRFDALVDGLIRKASGNGRWPVSIFSEWVGTLYASGQGEAAIRVEQLWERQVQHYPMRVLCAYPMSAFAEPGHDAAFQHICAMHGQVNPLERVWDIHELAELHRVVAQLQQRANALEAELSRQRDAGQIAASQDSKIAAMAAARAEFERLASQDPLTGLSNRRIFNDRLTHAVARAARDGTSLALIFIDIDAFKAVNDTYGHAAGDQLLKQVAARLSLCARSADTVSRWGGDEFGIITEDTDEQRAGVLMQRIEAALESPFDISGKPMVMRASLGLCLYPEQASDMEALLHNADAAMYRAKRRGRDAAGA